MISFVELGKKGRLGNCLFQIATTISHAIDNNDSYLFPPWDQEQNFNLHGCFSTNISYQRNYIEPFFHYQKISYTSNTNLSGYFQSHKYFREDFVKKLLTPTIAKEISLIKDTCAIHVRRGDYVTNFPNHHPALSISYYQKAQQLALSRFYLIFSDDISWCKQNFQGPQYSFSENNLPHADLAIMSKCENGVIMANSSFSWWGAYLNNSPQKKIIAPNSWFGPALRQHNTKDLYMEDWIRI